jgi:hypothetical protein
MIEHSTQPENDYPKIVGTMLETAQGNDIRTVSRVAQEIHSSESIVWTPRFIVLFFLTLIVGLSVESLCTYGWLDGMFRAEWILLAHALLILVCLFAIIIKGRSTWIRVGAIFGCIWALFVNASHITTLLGVNERSTIAAQFQAVVACALLATYICISTHRIPFRRWDSIFFWLAPFIGAGAVIVLYTFSWANPHHVHVLINAITTVLLSLCVAIWWLRISCWRSQPCLTFLFGAASLLLLLLPFMHSDSNGTPFFFSQVLLLCLLLGVLRVWQGELRQL